MTFDIASFGIGIIATCFALFLIDCMQEQSEDEYTETFEASPHERFGVTLTQDVFEDRLLKLYQDATQHGERTIQ